MLATSIDARRPAEAYIHSFFRLAHDLELDSNGAATCLDRGRIPLDLTFRLHHFRLGSG